MDNQNNLFLGISEEALKFLFNEAKEMAMDVSDWLKYSNLQNANFLTEQKADTIGKVMYDVSQKHDVPANELQLEYVSVVSDPSDASNVYETSVVVKKDEIAYAHINIQPSDDRGNDGTTYCIYDEGRDVENVRIMFEAARGLDMTHEDREDLGDLMNAEYTTTEMPTKEEYIEAGVEEKDIPLTPKEHCERLKEDVEIAKAEEMKLTREYLQLSREAKQAGIDPDTCKEVTKKRDDIKKAHNEWLERKAELKNTKKENFKEAVKEKMQNIKGSFERAGMAIKVGLYSLRNINFVEKTATLKAKATGLVQEADADFMHGVNSVARKYHAVNYGLNKREAMYCRKEIEKLNEKVEKRHNRKVAFKNFVTGRTDATAKTRVPAGIRADISRWTKQAERCDKLAEKALNNYNACKDDMHQTLTQVRNTRENLGKDVDIIEKKIKELDKYMDKENAKIEKRQEKYLAKENKERDTGAR